MHGDPGEVGCVSDSELASALQRVFGAEGLRALFGRADAEGARRLNSGGLNHVFMVALAGRLAKCTRPRSMHLSEAREAERLLREAPGLASDVHTVFPLAAFLCRERMPVASGPQPCEVVVFEHLEGCRSLGDLLRMYERTHPVGALRGVAPCPQHRHSGACEHIAQLRSLVAQQAARLNWRFQAMHGRRHGDFKADNVLLDRRGVLRLADFLSPFCTSCDKDEFLGSTDSVHPAINEMRGAFDCAWQAEAQRAEVLARVPGCLIAPEEAFHNVQLLEALERLTAARQSQSLFGPVPSLLSNIGMIGPGMAMMPVFSTQKPPALMSGALAIKERSRSEFFGEEDGSSHSSFRSESSSSFHSSCGSPYSPQNMRSSYTL